MTGQLPLPFSFQPEHSFQAFHGDENLEAVKHLQTCADGDGESVVFVWGEAGLGKTHLLHACCQHAQRSGLRVSYLPLQELRGSDSPILDGLSVQHLVCVDDLHAIAGQAQWERGLFNLFNELRDYGHRLIVSANQPPNALAIALPDLQTRLAWGLTLKLRPLSDDGKLAVLMAQAKNLGLELSPSVGRYLLARQQRDLTHLRALLHQLDHATLAAQRKLTVPFVKAYLETSL